MTRTVTSTATTFSLKRGTLGYGTLAGGLMVGYFLLLNLLGWQQGEAARFGSFLLVVLAVVLALRAYWASRSGPVPYLSGLGLCFAVSLLGSVLYAIFIYL